MRTVFSVGLAVAVVGFATFASRDNASGGASGPTSGTAAPTSRPPYPLDPPAGASVIASGTLGAGATWSVLAGDVGCFYPRVHVGTSTGGGMLCVSAAINPKKLPWTLGEAGAPLAYVLAVARRGTKEIRVVTRIAGGQRTSVLAHPISAPVHGYVVFFVPVPLHSYGVRASTAKGPS